MYSTVFYYSLIFGFINTTIDTFKTTASTPNVYGYNELFVSANKLHLVTVNEKA